MDTPSLPIYFQISREIIQHIRQKKLLPGDKILSENEIIKKYNVSNTTARKVLLEIEKGGYVKKIKGKGTFVQKNVELNRPASKVLSFTKNMQQLGFTPSTRLLDCVTQEVGITKSIQGRNYTLNGPVCKITRLRFADNKPVLREVRYISLKFCPGIDQLNLENSLYNIYEIDYHLHIARIEQSLSAIIIDESEKDTFGNDETIPGFKVDGVTFCGTELILEIEESIYNGEFYKFTIEAVP
ncbi:MAG: GntR family transcriptional regulator [Candidatus Cyclobacteriaceae bacterium M3_2C_046]